MIRSFLSLFRRQQPASAPEPAPSIFDLLGRPATPAPDGSARDLGPGPPSVQTKLLDVQNRFSSVEHFYHFCLGFLAPLLLHMQDQPDAVDQVHGVTRIIRSCGPMDAHIAALPRLEIVAKQHWRKLRQEKAFSVDCINGFDDPAHYDALAFAAVRHILWQRLGVLSHPRDATAPILLIDRGKSPDFYQSEASEVKTSANMRRTVPNMREVKEALASRGFAARLVELETASLQEQVTLFAATRIVVAQHGAALANMLWMAPGAAIIEINPMDPSSKFYDHFRHLASHCGHAYACTRQAGVHEPVDAAEIVAAVDAALTGRT